MQIVQTRRFKNTVKRLHANQKELLDEAVRTIADEPGIGEAKVGDLAGVRVYKFRMVNQLTLLAYLHETPADRLTLLTLGSHENFYRDLKER